MKKQISIAVLCVLIAGGGGFYGGIKYEVSKVGTGQFLLAGLQNLSPAERQQRLQRFGTTQGSGFQGRMGGGSGGRGGFITGEILSKDNTSITVKLNDGGSKIIFLSASTTISKSSKGSLSDLELGARVMANGVTNSDGSVTAQAIQLSPQQPIRAN